MFSATLRSRPGWRDAWVVAPSAGTMLLGAAALLATTERLAGLNVFALPFVASAAVLAMAPRAPLARPAAVLLSFRRGCPARRDGTGTRAGQGERESEALKASSTFDLAALVWIAWCNHRTLRTGESP